MREGVLYGEIGKEGNDSVITRFQGLDAYIKTNRRTEYSNI